MRDKSQWGIHPGVLFNALMLVVIKGDRYLRPKLVKNSLIIIYFFETEMCDAVIINYWLLYSYSGKTVAK